MVVSNRYSLKANLAIRKHQLFFASLRAASPESPFSSRIPNPESRVTAIGISMCNYCILGSGRRTVFGTGSGFDGPSSPRDVPSASPQPRVRLFSSQRTPNPESRTPALSEPRELYEYQRIAVKKNISRPDTRVHGGTPIRGDPRNK